MSTLKTTNLQHPSAASPAIVLDADGNATVAGMGLVHINTTTITSATAVSLDSVFTSSYRNYLIVYDLVASTTANPTLRLRLSGTDNTASEYDQQYILSSSSTVVAGASNAQTSWGIAAVGDRLYTTATIDIFRPNLAAPTLLQASSGQSNINGGSSGNRTTTGSHRASTSFDGFTVAFSTATGSLSVYGYSNGA